MFKFLGVLYISELNGTDEIIVESKGSHKNIHDFLDLNNDDLIEEYKEVLPNNTKSRIEWIPKSRHINEMTHCMTITTKQDRWPNAGILFCDVNGKLIDNQNDWNINGDIWLEIQNGTFSEKLFNYFQGFNEIIRSS